MIRTTIAGREGCYGFTRPGKIIEIPGDRSIQILNVSEDVVRTWLSLGCIKPLDPNPDQWQSAPTSPEQNLWGIRLDHDLRSMISIDSSSVYLCCRLDDMGWLGERFSVHSHLDPKEALGDLAEDAREIKDEIEKVFGYSNISSSGNKICWERMSFLIDNERHRRLIVSKRRPMISFFFPTRTIQVFKTHNDFPNDPLISDLTYDDIQSLPEAMMKAGLKFASLGD